MVNATSGYMNNVSSLYNYSYNAMRSVSSDYNTAGVNRQDNRQSYINNDAVRYVATIRANAGNVLDSLDSVSNASTSGRMMAAYDDAVRAMRNDGNEAEAVREREPARTEDAGTVAGTDTARTAFGRIGGEASERTQAAGPEDADAGILNTALEGINGEAAARPERTEGSNAAGNTADNLAGAVRDMAESFNGLLEAAEAGPGGNRLLSDLRDATADYATSLRRIGVTANEDGSLAIDEDRLASAGRSGALEEAFAPGGANSGFANQLTRIAEGVRGDRPVYEQQSIRNDADSAQNRATRMVNNAVETYRQSMNNYNYAYGYSAPGTLFNLYA